MDKRREELLKLKSYTEGIDNELTMILQTLQWDRKQLLQNPVLVSCRYDANHKVPPDKTEEHEKACFLRQNGYKEDDQLLPDPPDPESNTLVKLGKEDIEQIIGNASRSDHLFKKVFRKIVQGSEQSHLNSIYNLFYYKHLYPKSFLNQGVGCRGPEPLSLERLQASYSADERRVIYDAVVSAVPSCHDLTDLALLSGGDEKSTRVILSRQEILVELRNMRRRRTKYRVAAKSRNYSDVLRDVIKTQMELYNEGKCETEAKETVGEDNNQIDNDRRPSRPAFIYDSGRFDGKVVPRPITVVVKTEKRDSAERNRDYGRERSDRTYRHEVGSRERRDIGNDRRRRDDRSGERRHKDRLDRTQHYGEHSRKRRHDDETRDRRNYYEESKDRRKYYDSDKEDSFEKSAKRSRRHKDYYSEYQEKKEPGIDDEPYDHHRARSRENRREEESGHKVHKHKHKRHRDRDRSREGRRDDRYEERERIHIKQEREDSYTRDDTSSSNYENEKANRSRTSKHSRYDRSYRDGHSLEIKQERYDRYYDGPPEDIYDPDKKIKVEK